MADRSTVAERVFTHPVLTRLLGVRVAKLRYRGRRSGREISLTTWCKPTAEGVLITVGGPGRKTWWRNFRTAGPIEIEVDGVRHLGTAQVREPKPGRVQVAVTYS